MRAEGEIDDEGHTSFEQARVEDNDEYNERPLKHSTGPVDAFEPINHGTGSGSEYDEIENPLHSVQQKPHDSPLDLSTSFTRLSKRHKLNAQDTSSQFALLQLVTLAQTTRRPPLADLSSNLTSGLTWQPGRDPSSTPRRLPRSSNATTATPALQHDVVAQPLAMESVAVISTLRAVRTRNWVQHVPRSGDASAMHGRPCELKSSNNLAEVESEDADTFLKVLRIDDKGEFTYGC
ncbi:hypothetical protein LTR27_007848 [Elasticomyces elasticus]|nr:hypothetical protein LTR27_007848 [Elasticomyces elasticus]